MRSGVCYGELSAPLPSAEQHCGPRRGPTLGPTGPHLSLPSGPPSRLGSERPSSSTSWSFPLVRGARPSLRAPTIPPCPLGVGSGAQPPGRSRPPVLNETPLRPSCPGWASAWWWQGEVPRTEDVQRFVQKTKGVCLSVPPGRGQPSPSWPQRSEPPSPAGPGAHSASIHEFPAPGRQTASWLSLWETEREGKQPLGRRHLGMEAKTPGERAWSRRGSRSEGWGGAEVGLGARLEEPRHSQATRDMACDRRPLEVCTWWD